MDGTTLIPRHSHFARLWLLHRYKLDRGQRLTELNRTVGPWQRHALYSLTFWFTKALVQFR